MNGGSSPPAGEAATPSVAHAETATTEPQPFRPSSSGVSETPTPGNSSSNVESMSSTSVIASPGPDGPSSSSKNLSAGGKDPKDPRKRPKMTPEQRAKLQELDKERRKAMEERISGLTKKLIDKLRPFVEAKLPGDKDDTETIAFEHRIKREADDLKLESFGVEVGVILMVPLLS